MHVLVCVLCGVGCGCGCGAMLQDKPIRDVRVQRALLSTNRLGITIFINNGVI